jgi:hypothetical protein
MKIVMIVLLSSEMQMIETAYKPAVATKPVDDLCFSQRAPASAIIRAAPRRGVAKCG